MQDTKIFIGPPGTGKTTKLISIMEQELNSGVDPSKLAFVSFSKKAAYEARDRAIDKFDLTVKDLPLFRTIHSLAFHVLGIKRDDVLQAKDYKKIGEHLGINFGNITPDYTIENTFFGNSEKGARYVSLDGLARARCIEPKDLWEKISTNDLNWYEFFRYKKILEDYKMKRNMYDFPDMLQYCDSVLESPEVLIVDEAQDLSKMQWSFINRVFAKVKRVYIAGDDDQAIYSWGGADVTHFQKLAGGVEILHQSHRVPKSVHKLAEEIAHRIDHRTAKEYLPTSEKGLVEYHRELANIDMSEGTWLILARNVFIIPELAATVKQMGYNALVKGNNLVNSNHVRAIRAWEHQRKGNELTMTEKGYIKEYVDNNADSKDIWHKALSGIALEDREFYISLLRRKENLELPRIHINTIHAVKGGEADNVVLCSDMSYSTWEGQKLDADSEHRVWYVGVTRCKKNLHIILPKRRYYYDL